MDILSIETQASCLFGVKYLLLWSNDCEK